MFRIGSLFVGIVGASFLSTQCVLGVVINVDFAIDGSQVVAPVSTSGSGNGSVTLDTLTNEMGWSIAYCGIPTSVTGAHFHGPASAGTDAGVQVDIGAISGLASPLVGSANISHSQEQDVLNGNWYVNIHTSDYPGGEIRGQLADIPLVALDFPLSGLQEAPPVSTDATGFAAVTYDPLTNLLSWDVEFADIDTSITGAHFHGPAALGVNAGVQVNIGAISGLESPLIGSTTITDDQESQLLDGLWYVNIHSTANPGGELRGQVVPEPSTVLLLTAVIFALPIRGFRNRKHAF